MFILIQKAPSVLPDSFHLSVGCQHCGLALEGWGGHSGVAGGGLLVSEELWEQISGGYLPALACSQLRVVWHGLWAASAVCHHPC